MVNRLLTILLLCTLTAAQDVDHKVELPDAAQDVDHRIDLPDAPQPQPKQAHVIRVKSWDEVFRGKYAWAFYAEHGISLLATTWDVEATHQGLAGCHQLVEGNPELPRHPSRGQLYGNNLAWWGGLTVVDLLLRKAGVPIAPHVTWAEVTVVHVQAGMGWRGCL